MVVDEVTTRPYTFRDDDANNFWWRIAERPEWPNGRPDPDAGSNHLLRPRYFRKRLQPLHQIQAVEKLVINKTYIEERIHSILNDVKLPDDLSTPRGQIGLFEGESFEQLRKRKEEFTVSGIENLLFDTNGALEREVAASSKNLFTMKQFDKAISMQCSSATM